MPFPGPDSPPRNEWSDWYASTEPSSPFEPPASAQPDAQQPQTYPATAYRTTIAPDNEATQYKTAFATEWNPIATRYDLTTYQQGQL